MISFVRKSDVNRVIIQRIISSDASKFVKYFELQDLHKKFLQENLEDLRIELYFVFDATEHEKGSYWDARKLISSLSFKWEELGDEELLENGEVWQTYKVITGNSISASYGISPEDFSKRLEALKIINELLVSICETVPEKIRLMKHSRAEKIRLDDEDRRKQIHNEIRRVLRKHPDLRFRLRVGGKKKYFSRTDAGLSPVVPSGMHEVSFSPSPSSRSEYRKYLVSVPEDPNRPCSIARIS